MDIFIEQIKHWFDNHVTEIDVIVKKPSAEFERYETVTEALRQASWTLDWLIQDRLVDIPTPAVTEVYTCRRTGRKAVITDMCEWNPCLTAVYFSLETFRDTQITNHNDFHKNYKKV